VIGRTGPLTSIADAETRANRRLPRAVRLALRGGSGSGEQLRRNVDSFREILLDARVGNQPQTPDLTTRVLDQNLALPVIIAPVGAQAVRSGAEVSAARAAARSGTVLGISNFSDTAIEDVIPHNPGTFTNFIG